MQLPEKGPTLNGSHCQRVPRYGETDEESTVAPLDFCVMQPPSFTHSASESQEENGRIALLIGPYWPWFVHL